MTYLFSTYANKFSHDPEKQEILASKHELFKQLGFLGHHMSQTALKQLHHGGEYLFFVNDKTIGFSMLNGSTISFNSKYQLVSFT